MFLQIVIEVQETIGNLSEIYVFFYFECRYLSYMYMHIINIVMRRALSPNFDVGRGSFSIKCRKKRIIKDFTKKLPVKSYKIKSRTLNRNVRQFPQHECYVHACNTLDYQIPE